MKNVIYISCIFMVLFANDIQAAASIDTQKLQAPQVNAPTIFVAQSDPNHSKKDADAIEFQKTSEAKRGNSSPGDAGSHKPSESEKKSTSAHTSKTKATTTVVSKTTTVSITITGPTAKTPTTADAAAPTKATQKAIVTPAAPIPTTPETAPTPKLAGPIDCAHPVITTSEQNLSLWGQYAASKAFEYSYDQLDNQLETLKTCFTPQGWTGFHEALQQSGNISIIKNQQFSVSSQIVGKAVVSPLKSNDWKIVVPVEVVYQNDQKKFSQSLAVTMVVTKKNETELGIVQLIATINSDETPPAS